MSKERLAATAVREARSWEWSTTGLSYTYGAEIVRTTGPLLLVDLSALVVSGLVAMEMGDSPRIAIETSNALIPALGAHLLAFLTVAGLYPGAAMNPVDEFRRITIATTLAFVSYSIAALGLGGEPAQWPVLVLAWLLTLPSIASGRVLARSVFSQFPWWGFRTVVVGKIAAAKHAYEALQSHPTQGLRPMALLDGTTWQWPDAAPGIHYAVFAVSEGSLVDQTPRIGELSRRFLRVLVVFPDTVGMFGGGSMRASQCGAVHGIEVRDLLLSRSSHLIKRLFDLFLAILASPALLLLTPVVALINKSTSPGPVFFGQERIGKDGRLFKIWKFRTMMTNADALLSQHLEQQPKLREEWRQTQKLRQDPRITKIGRWLRRTSFDEVPQIWNVFRGQMSIVGPRPIVEEEIPKYGASYEAYARVRPGLTGLWQVSGRNNRTYAERVALDSSYVSNWSVWLDLYIVLRTFRAVLTGDGAR